MLSLGWPENFLHTEIDAGIAANGRPHKELIKEDLGGGIYAPGVPYTEFCYHIQTSS